ncbi:MAG: hypothetical protein QOE23_3910 [Pseudonocardiales bacterium]|jgi:hypothetical protein|nr:hypothetical protein [Pseudonocardiales bacterium]
MTQATQTVTASEPEDLLCAACGHSVRVHDATATRYCAATEASGAVRGCLCPPDALSTGVQRLRTTQPFR